MKFRNLGIIGLAAIMFSLCGCNASSSDNKMQEAQEQIADRANSAVGMPSITHFFEKRQLKTIYEDRDNPKFATYTYLVDMNGQLHFFCHSIGYGIPYSTQYTNPQRDIYHGADGITTIPQADPNALFSPPSSDGTWVICQNPNKTDEVHAVYVEPRVISSPWELKSIDSLEKKN